MEFNGGNDFRDEFVILLSGQIAMLFILLAIKLTK
jgi:hypothetical protein